MANSKDKNNNLIKTLKFISSELVTYKQTKDEKLLYSIITAASIHLPKVSEKVSHVSNTTEEEKLNVVLGYIYKELVNYSNSNNKQHLINAEQAAIEGVKAFSRIANDWNNSSKGTVSNLTGKYHVGGLTKNNS